MSKVVARIKCDTRKWNEFFAKAKAALPEEKKAAFADHWYKMQENGCVVGETIFHNGTVYCAPSDDFRRALAEFGIVVK